MEKNNSSYNQIIKSTSIFGGSQVITIIIGIVRVKIIALLLGPVGIGIIGIYQSIVDMIRSTAGLGIDTGGVREIAAIESKKDKSELNKIISIFNRWFIATALFGLIICIVFCYPISIWAFEDTAFALPIAGLSVCVFLTIITTGKSVIMQGLRRISYIAKSTVWGSFIGLIITLPLYYFLGLRGIILAFIISSLVLYFCTDYYYRKLDIEPVDVSNKAAFEAGVNTLKLGLYIVIAGIINTASMFLIRTFITRSIGIESAGLFQSAWTITNVYLGLILKSMGSDYFPRLSAIAEDKEKINKLVNEQTYVVLVIASPIILGMLLFSDFALSVLYSSKFTNAEAVLQWQIVGTFFKVITWPIAFILLAKHKGMLFLFSEALFYTAYLLSSYILFPRYGLDATGIGYLIAYLIYLPIIIIIGKRISDFRWDKNILLMAIIHLSLIAISFYITRYQTNHIYSIGSIILIVSIVYSYFKLKKVFGLDDLKKWFRK